MTDFDYEELLQMLRPRAMPELTPAEFIEQYKSQWINYCEVIIMPSGSIILAQPSHSERLIHITGINRDELYSMIPISASPIHWLLEYTGCMSVWHDFQLVFKSKQTAEQLDTLNRIVEAKLAVYNVQSL